MLAIATKSAHWDTFEAFEASVTNIPFIYNEAFAPVKIVLEDRCT